MCGEIPCAAFLPVPAAVPGSLPHTAALLTETLSACCHLSACQNYSYHFLILGYHYRYDSGRITALGKLTKTDLNSNILYTGSTIETNMDMI